MTDVIASWTDAVSGDAAWAGDIDTTISLTVLATPDGDVTSTWRIASGHIEPLQQEDAAVSATVPWKIARELVSGDKEPAVAYMQGDLKPSGDMEAVLRLLALTSQPSFRSWIGAMRP